MQFLTKHKEQFLIRLCVGVRELLNSWRALYLRDMDKLELLDIQSFPLEVKNQIEDKINEIVEWINEQEQLRIARSKLK